MKTYLRIGALLCLFSAPVSGAIIVTSTVTATTDGVRAQATIENTSSFNIGDPGPLGVAVKEFRGTIIIRDDVTPPSNRGGPTPGLLVKKHILTAQQAYGLGQTNGYASPPTTDPGGPWQGLCWPYRDQYDYFNTGQPLADDVGTPFSDEPDVYGFLNVTGIARGGPTEPGIPAPGQSTPAWLDRGLTGNGLNGPATFFNFDIIALSGQPDRFVRVRIIGASAIVVQKLGDTYSEVEIPVDDSENFYIQLPEPATAATIGAIGVSVLGARRRRK